MKKEWAPILIQAKLSDYPTIQNMARFYIYDRTPTMLWACPENGLFECIDFKHYFENPAEKAFLIKVEDEIAGFVLLDKIQLLETVDWNMGEFFVLAKFQGKGIAQIIAKEIFEKHPGKWSVAVMPENIKAVKFWRKIIADLSAGNYSEIFKTKDELKTRENPDPYAMNVFCFSTDQKTHYVPRKISIRPSEVSDIPDLVQLSYQKRRAYEQAQPQLWKYAGSHAETSQAQWFLKLRRQENHIMLTALRQEKIIGFIIGVLVPAPEVYNPGGLTLTIDDFCVEHDTDWPSTGSQLIRKITEIAKENHAVQIFTVCGAHDDAKRRFLQSIGLSLASEWYVGSIPSKNHSKF